MSSKIKKALGQFYTTNHEYILQNMELPNYVRNIIEPFAGNGDLLQFIEKDENQKNIKYNIECYDIEPKEDYIKKRDTIKNPPLYKDKFVLTNPPYLARNKTDEKTLFEDLLLGNMKIIAKNPKSINVKEYFD